MVLFQFTLCTMMLNSINGKESYAKLIRANQSIYSKFTNQDGSPTKDGAFFATSVYKSSDLCGKLMTL